jgi:hypothetical protein
MSREAHIGPGRGTSWMVSPLRNRTCSSRPTRGIGSFVQFWSKVIGAMDADDNVMWQQVGLALEGLGPV